VPVATSINGCEISVGVGAVGVTLIVAVASGKSGVADSGESVEAMPVEVGITTANELVGVDSDVDVGGGVDMGVDDTAIIVSSDAGWAGGTSF